MSQSQYLFYDQDKSYLVLKDYKFILKVNLPRVNLVQTHVKLKDIIDCLFLEMSSFQSKVFSMIKNYHKDMHRVVLEFDINNILVNQTRHYFSFIEKNFVTPYKLSNFNADKQVTLAEMVKNSELRIELLKYRDKLLNENEDCESLNFTFQNTNYMMSVIHSNLDLQEAIGFVIIIENSSESKQTTQELTFHNGKDLVLVLDRKSNI